ncbi:MAG: YfgM family protein [Limisphaerales bacterium]
MEAHEAAVTFFLKLWPQIEANKNRILGAAVIVLVIVLIILFFSWRHQQNQIDAGDALTQSLITIPPDANPAQLSRSYLAIADDYSGTPAAGRALLQGATVLFSQGKYTDARAYFQRYLDEHPDDEFAGIAALGVARCLEAEGRINDAMGAYQHVIDDFADAQCVNQARFSEAQISMEQGRYPEAFQNFQAVVQADPYGALGNEARQYAFELESKLPRQPPTVPASGFKLNH